MAVEKHIIEPERLGLWVAAAFIVSLLALVVSFVQKARTDDMMMATQLQILKLNQKIEDSRKPASAPVATPAAPAATAPAQAQTK